MTAYACKPRDSEMRGRDRQIPGSVWPTSLAYLTMDQAVKRPYLTYLLKKKWKSLDWQSRLSFDLHTWPMHTYSQNYSHTHTCNMNSQTHIYCARERKPIKILHYPHMLRPYWKAHTYGLGWSWLDQGSSLTLCDSNKDDQVEWLTHFCILGFLYFPIR